MEYFIYCDESVSEGKYYSNFYGGALVRSIDFDRVNSLLNDKKLLLNLKNEIKWNKVTENYLEKYKEMMNLYFELIRKDIIKVRIMFSQNANVPSNLTKENRDNGFHLLYYQFVKHAFGLRYHNAEPNKKIFLRLYFDKLPANELKNETFKTHIYGLQGLEIFRKAKLKIRYEDIAEVDSHEHAILQCMDIILGAMAFRLNDGHKEKNSETNKRGKKTIAKTALYQHILKLIRSLENHSNFNIGVSTGRSETDSFWKNPYRHWKFVPAEFTIDKSRYK
ncbi:MAG: DUF3800 domain-containing protein [Prevotellaceae bacterium]|jgi:hypothetical protein|nr:DUF3800 domain-containing protein [Prevotellaceae bacterium]